MVVGLDVFRAYFGDFPDQYVIIGGTACDVVLTAEGLTPRATKDIDIILVIEALNPAFKNVVGTKAGREFAALGANAGGLVPTMAEKLGLPAGIAVAVANVDAHVTAPPSATEPGIMVMIMGTSTCHMISGANSAKLA
jgi:hypothetical protein